MDDRQVAWHYSAVRLHASEMWRRFRIVCAVLLSLALLSWVALRAIGSIVQGDFNRAAQLATVVSAWVGVAGLLISVAPRVMSGWRGARAGSGSDEVADHVPAVAEALANSVRGQWMDEDRIRRVSDPYPLPVRWDNAPAHLTASWESIHGSPDRRLAIPLAGGIEDIAETFERVPSGRLVVLGKAGAGKTILTSRFVLRLLARWTSSADEPVPVIFSAGSWNPTEDSLRRWLVTR